MSDSIVPRDWETQVENLAQRFSVSRAVALQAMQRSKGHAGKAARMLRLHAPETTEQIPLADPPGSKEKDPFTPAHSLEPEPEPEPKTAPSVELSVKILKPRDETMVSSHDLAVRHAVVDTLAALEAATNELRALNQDCYEELSIARGISVLGQLEAVVQSYRARLIDMQRSSHEPVSVPLPSFFELWSALRELEQLYAQTPDQEEFFEHSMREIWVSIDELVSDDGSHAETASTVDEWRDADPDLLLATAQGLQTQELWSSAILVFTRLLDRADADENHTLRSSRQLYYNGRGMCYSRLGDKEAAASDIDAAGALVTAAGLQL